MKESTTYQATLEEGRVEGAKDLFVMLAKDRLGPPTASMLRRLHAINDLELIERLGQRLAHVASWDDLLATSETTHHRPRKRKP